jgi:hypothetical protein
MGGHDDEQETEMTDELEPRERWKQLTATLLDVMHAIQGVAGELPSWWEQPECCGGQDLRLVTDGYGRWCQIEFDPAEPDKVTAYQDGWDDMSEDGFVTVLQCMECGAAWREPEEVNWS